MIDGLRTELERITGVVKTVLNLPVLNFQAADYQETISRLQSWAEDPTKRAEMFPMVYVQFPFEAMNPSGDYERVRVQIFIINATNPEYNLEARYTYNFNPVLLPIYHELCKQLQKSRFFVCYNPVRDMQHRKRLLDFWGKDGIAGSPAKVFNNFIDAVQMENLELNLSPITYS